MDVKHRKLAGLRLFFACTLLALAAGQPSPVRVEASPLSISPNQIPPVQQALPAAPAAPAGLQFTAIAAGGDHTCALVSGGGVMCWGANDSGQLGDGTTASRSMPVAVSGLDSGVTALAVGGGHTCALLSGGGVKCWGRNWDGQIGDGSTSNRSTPVDVSGMNAGVTALAAGLDQTCAVVNGGVKCWGRNWNGQLGDGSTTSRSAPVNVSGLTSGVVGLAGGGTHTCALLSSGGVKCWGANSSGQVGDATTTQRLAPVAVSGLASGVVGLAAGGAFTCALLGSGGVKCWGANSDGQLGDGTTTKRLAPVAVSGLASGVTALIAGGAHTCALLGGGVKCWGYNLGGQLGDGTTASRSTPVAVSGLASGVTSLAAGVSHTCALLGAGAVCWGNNAYGQSGDGAITWRSVPVDVSGITGGLTALAAGHDHTCGLESGGGVKCWGNNYNGQLGDGTTTGSGTPVAVSGLAGVTDLSAGSNHTCAVAAGGVKCWGDNSYGQLGDGTTTQRLTPVSVSGLTSGAIAVAAAMAHTCALLSSGGVKCWGDNMVGQLGDNTTTQHKTPVAVSGLSSGVKALTARTTHTCALLTSGVVKCWGSNGAGELGDGTTTDRHAPVTVNGLGGAAAAVAAGGGHTCAVSLIYTDAMCWGMNNTGQLGSGDWVNWSSPQIVSGVGNGVTALAAGGYHTCALYSDGHVSCWGSNDQGQLGEDDVDDRNTAGWVAGLSAGATALTAGWTHTCALVGAGRPVCWGWDVFGQLGAGAITQRSTPVAVVDSVAPVLMLNYSYAQPGSLLTVSGWNFPPDSGATLSINNQVISTVGVNLNGSFIYFLDTAGAEPGSYAVTVSGPPAATASFFLANDSPLRPVEGGGSTYVVPPGIAFHNLAFVPVLHK